MRIAVSLLLPVLVAVAVACGGSVGIGGGGGGIGIGAGVNTNRESYQKQINDWHEWRIERLTAEDGWLTLVGLIPIGEGENTFGSAADNLLALPATAPAHAGTLSMTDKVVTLTPAADVEMTLDGKRIGPTVLASDATKAGPSRIRLGSIQFYVIERNDELFLRVKDSNSPVRKSFKGIDRFPVDSKWRFDAVLERYDPPRLVKIPNIRGYEDIVPCPGVLIFEKDGVTYRLEALVQEGDELEVVFGDATSGEDTYGGGREVYVTMPGPDGKTAIDFNKAYNPPCVFTEFATCPLPHRDNVLPFRVEAGEKAWDGANH
jgi:uncharacterized protein (DUF1684 family)